MSVIDVVLISGLPGSGKTSVARRLTETLPRSAYISGDALRHMIVGGYKKPGEPWDEETRRQYYLAFKNAADLARNMVGQDFRVVIDDVVHPGDLFQEWKRHFEGLAYQPIVLFPTLEVVIERNRRRECPVSEQVIRRLYLDFAGQGYSGWLVIDNSGLSVEEAAVHIGKQSGWSS